MATGGAFRAHVERILVPTLGPGGVVVMDNLASHKGRAVRDAIRAARANLPFLPPYSPDPNPIEHLNAFHYLARPAFDDLIRPILGDGESDGGAAGFV